MRDCVETNFSCPNVSTCDGQLYQNPDDAGLVARYVREEIGKVPYVVKIGHVRVREDAGSLLESLAPFVDALAMTNSVAATVMGESGKLLFDGAPRGICGTGSREASLAQLSMFHDLKVELDLPCQLVGGGRYCFGNGCATLSGSGSQFGSAGDRRHDRSRRGRQNPPPTGRRLGVE